MIDNILFDLDGTLTDSGLGITRSVAYALEKLGYKAPGYDELKKFIGPPLGDSFEMYYGFTPEQVEEGLLLFREYFSEKGIFENKPYPGIDTLLATLKNNNKNLLVATSKPEFFANKILDHFDLAQYFSTVVGSPMEGRGTPKNVIVSETLKAGNIDAGSSVMVGDRKHDIMGAQKNNVLSVGVEYGFGDFAELQAAGADYIANDIPHLTKILLSL